MVVITYPTQIMQYYPYTYQPSWWWLILIGFGVFALIMFIFFGLPIILIIELIKAVAKD